MNEKIRIMNDGNRLVILIEECTPELLQKAKSILDVAVTDIVGLDNPTPADVSVDIPDKEKDKEVNTSKSINVQNRQQDTDPFIFPKGKHAGHSVLDIVMQDDFSFLHFLLVKINYANRDKVWNDLLKASAEVAQHVREKYAEDPTTILKYLCEIYDKEPGKAPVTPEIAEAIGYANISEVLNQKDKNDIDYVFDTIVGYIEKRGQK